MFKKNRARSNGAISDVNPNDVKDVIEKTVKIARDLLK